MRSRCLNARIASASLSFPELKEAHSRMLQNSVVSATVLQGRRRFTAAERGLTDGRRTRGVVFTAWSMTIVGWMFLPSRCRICGVASALARFG